MLEEGRKLSGQATPNTQSSFDREIFVEGAEAQKVEQSWARVRGRLRSEVGDAAFRSWLKPLTLVSLRESVVRMAVPSRFMRDWVTGNYAERIRDLWLEEADFVRSIEIVVQAPPPANPAIFSGREGSDEDTSRAPQLDATQLGDTQLDATQLGDLSQLGKSASSAQRGGDLQTNERAAQLSSGRTSSAAQDSETSISAPLDPRFTFDNFVVGKPNELAYAAARRVAESDGVPFNPLFLYGGVGLGKTHLMHAIAWHITRSRPGRKVIYLSAEKFMYQFIRALRTKDTMAFKEQFRSVDVLMIDDVQFISGREATQEEFFHTFNALVDHNRQIIISADKSPSDLEGLDERMRSRFGWGLVADIHPTTYELRLGILQAKAEQLACTIPPKVLEFLAHKIVSNVRELEGALNRIVAHATLVGRAVTLENTQEVLHDLLRASDRRVTIDDIQKRVAEHYNIRLADMHSARRARAVARPRQVAMYLAKQLTSRSLPEIGRQFGGRDHTTVMHAVRKVDELKSIDNAFAEDVDLLRRMLEG